MRFGQAFMAATRINRARLGQQDSGPCMVMLPFPSDYRITTIDVFSRGVVIHIGDRQSPRNGVEIMLVRDTKLPYNGYVYGT